jgi:hypothetical protein
MTRAKRPGNAVPAVALTKPPAADFYTSRRFAVLFLLLWMLLILRKPDMLTNPQLFAEDGAIFLADQLMHPGTALIIPYNGYLHIVPRLIALIESLFAISAVPLICAVLTTGVQSFCFSVFFLPWNRHIVGSDPLRAAACVVMATTFEGEETLSFSGVLMWYLFFVAVLLLYRPAEGRAGSRWLGVVALCGFSCAPLMVIFPCAAWRIWRCRGEQRLRALVLCGTLAIQFACFALTPRTDHPASTGEGLFLLTTRVGTATLVTWLYRGILAPLIGKDLSKAMNDLPSIGMTLIAYTCAVAAVTWLFLRSGAKERRYLFFALYTALGAIAMSLFVRNLLGLAQSMTGILLFTAPRYFILASILSVYIACLALQRSSVRPALQPALLLLIFALGIRGNFPVPPYPDFHWKTYVPAIESWKRTRAETLTVPIAPAPRAILLPAGQGFNRK